MFDMLPLKKIRISVPDAAAVVDHVSLASDQEVNDYLAVSLGHAMR